jgi:3-deoxy-D-manno-octulosonic-acid transferase
VRILLSKGAALQVKNAAELERTLEELLGNPARRDELSRRALGGVAENHGSLERTVEMILPELERHNVYMAPKD